MGELLIDPTEQAFDFAFAGRSIGTAVTQVRAEFGTHPGQVMGGIDAPVKANLKVIKNAKWNPPIMPGLNRQ